MKKINISPAIAVIAALCLTIPCCHKAEGLISVLLDQSQLTISEGSSASLSARVLPERTSQDVVWSSLNSDIASVDKNGLVTGLVGGRTYIIATHGAVSAGCMVRVIAHVSGVELDFHEKTVERDGMFQLKARVLPDAASNDTVRWHSTNPEIAIVGNGIVTGLNVGKADIVVTTAEGGFSDTCHVEVISSVKRVVLDKESIKINVGNTQQLSATVEPAEATIKDVVWSSSDESIASVDQTGLVSAHARGNCTISVTSVQGGISAACNVEVYSPVTGVKCEKPAMELYVGDRITLKAEVLPSSANNTNVTWTSSQTAVAKVVATTGVLTTVSAGTAILTVKTSEGGFTDNCTVTVIQGTAPVSGVSLDKEALRLRVGGTYELFAAIQPVDAANKGVTWTSSSTSTATVDSYGKVTAKDAGTCTITAMTKDGNFKAVCTVTVVGFDTGTSGLDETGYLWQD